jgi:hypothetical protein
MSPSPPATGALRPGSTFPTVAGRGIFDYRHFGDSSGEPRQFLGLRKQYADWDAAVDYARQRPDIDATGIVLWGTSFSGGHVIDAAEAVSAPRPAAAGAGHGGSAPRMDAEAAAVRPGRGAGSRPGRPAGGTCLGFDSDGGPRRINLAQRSGCADLASAAGASACSGGEGRPREVRH